MQTSRLQQPPAQLGGCPEQTQQPGRTFAVEVRLPSVLTAGEPWLICLVQQMMAPCIRQVAWQPRMAPYCSQILLSRKMASCYRYSSRCQPGYVLLSRRPVLPPIPPSASAIFAAANWGRSCGLAVAYPVGSLMAGEDYGHLQHCTRVWGAESQRKPGNQSVAVGWCSILPSNRAVRLLRPGQESHSCASDGVLQAASAVASWGQVGDLA
mmetsp:Transcript_19590/g.59266  ORF Transcript_19590/g.59266 Transcript_19590/m.59266 type:complete len:210 (+) Transcript_19590:3604-4233(+)